MTDPDEDAPEAPSEGSPEADEAERGTEESEEPDIGEDDLAELDPDVVEKVAEETAGDDEGSDSGDGEDDARGDEGNSTGASKGESGSSGKRTVGGMYCRALGAAATGTREKWGSGVDGDPQEAREEYAELAEWIGLDEYVTEWYEQQGGAPELSPGQGMVAGTGMFAVLVLLDDGEMMDSAMDADALAEVVA